MCCGRIVEGGRGRGRKSWDVSLCEKQEWEWEIGFLRGIDE